jgi:hypothetical protein
VFIGARAKKHNYQDRTARLAPRKMHTVANINRLSMANINETVAKTIAVKTYRSRNQSSSDLDGASFKEYSGVDAGTFGEELIRVQHKKDRLREDYRQTL